MPLSIRVLKSVCLASLLLVAFDAGRYLEALERYGVALPMRTQFVPLLIDLGLGFLVGLGVTYIPGKPRIFVALAVLAIAYSVGVGTGATLSPPGFSPDCYVGRLYPTPHS